MFKIRPLVLFLLLGMMTACVAPARTPAATPAGSRS